MSIQLNKWLGKKFIRLILLWMIYMQSIFLKTVEIEQIQKTRNVYIQARTYIRSFIQLSV